MVNEWSPQAGHQLRRRSDGARFDVMYLGPRMVGRPVPGQTPTCMKLRNLTTGRNHWVRYEDWAKRYEPCPAP